MVEPSDLPGPEPRPVPLGKTSTAPKPAPTRGRPGPRKPERRSPEPIARISFPIDANGEPDWAHMQPATLDRLRAVYPALEASFQSDGGDLSADSFSPLVALSVVQALSEIQVLVIHRVTNAPAELTRDLGSYSATEQKQLAPLVTAVLEKHAARWMSKWGAEIILAGTVLLLGRQKLEIVQRAIRKPASVTQHPSAPLPVADQPADVAPGDPADAR